MSSRLLAVPVVVAALAGCMPSQNRETLGPQPAAPRTHIYASYTAGLGGQRTVRATFRTDQDAYVIVGHLGGDGNIRILYPANAYRSSQTVAGKSYQTRTETARYDANPQFYRMTPAAFRSPGARIDSYDGQGNGFVFMIASRSPLLVQMLPGAPSFDEIELEDYFYAFDPREGIREFADALSGGLPYTLDYANSLGTAASLTYAQHSIGCDAFDRPGYGMGLFDPFLSGWGYGYSWYFQRPSMYYTNRFWGTLGYTFGSSFGNPYGLGSCFGPGSFYSSALWAENRWTGVFTPTPYVPTRIYPRPGTPGGTDKTGMKLRGSRALDETGPAIALSRPSFAPRSGRIPTGSATTDPSGPSRLSGRRRAFDDTPTLRPATTSHTEPTRQAARSSGSYDTPRLAPSAPRATAPAASAPAPASPPPKVAASGAEKPRAPDKP